ncbi:hypothetical protein QBC44DRAFT_101759 [Cladorrhinum sp. PSN332]|nr:hypothetical protein QBC44DRAFT_101759 [Cladorrhinum sp. PSN332]
MLRTFDLTMGGQINMHPDFALPTIRMPYTTFADPWAIIEPTGPPGSETATAAATPELTSNNPNIGSNNTAARPNHFICPPPSSYRGTQYLWQTPPGKSSCFRDWKFPSWANPRPCGAAKQDNTAQLDDDDMKLSHYESEGFDPDLIDSQTDQYSRHTKLFLDDLTQAQSSSAPLREIFETRKEEWQKGVDKFCKTHPPSEHWEPDPFTRAEIRMLEELEADMLEAKEELDKSVKKGDDMMTNMLKWDFDSEGHKRKVKEKRDKAKKEMDAYVEMMKQMTMVDLSRRRGSSLASVRSEEDDKKFVELAVEQWKKGKGYLSENEDKNGKAMAKSSNRNEYIPREISHEIAKSSNPDEETSKDASQEMAKSSNPNEEISKDISQEMAKSSTLNEDLSEDISQEMEEWMVSWLGTGDSVDGELKKPKKQQREKKKPPSWFLILEARGVIREPPYEWQRGGVAQRYDDFERWLDEGAWKETCFVKGVKVKRWWFGGTPVEVGRNDRRRIRKRSADGGKE